MPDPYGLPPNSPVRFDPLKLVTRMRPWLRLVSGGFLNATTGITKRWMCDRKKSR